MPKGRTHDYAIWRACERLKIRPPNIGESWDDIDMWTQLRIIAFDQGRQLEESEELYRVAELNK